MGVGYGVGTWRGRMLRIGRVSRREMSSSSPPISSPLPSPAQVRSSSAPSASAFDFLHHDPFIARLNNGSFGSSPAPVLMAQQQHASVWRAQPDACYFSRTGLDAQLLHAAAAVADYIGADRESVCLVENATVAACGVAQRWAWDYMEGRSCSERDAVMVLSCCYGATTNIMRASVERAGARVVRAHVPFPVQSEEQVVESIRQCILQHRPKYIMIDHITSQPALVLPNLQRLVAFARQNGALEVAVDGAHAIGCLPRQDTNIPELDVDFYFSNLHKWAFAPSTASFLYRRKGLDPPLHHPITSWTYPADIVEESRWTGTRDYSAFLSVPTALEYLQTWRSDQGEGVVEYNSRRCWEEAQRLAREWNTSIGQPRSMASSMAMIRLPIDIDDTPGQPGKGVRATLREKYGVEAAVGRFGEDGSWLRLSHAIYNTPSDFDRLSTAVLDLAANHTTASGDGRV